MRSPRTSKRNPLLKSSIRHWYVKCVQKSFILDAEAKLHFIANMITTNKLKQLQQI